MNTNLHIRQIHRSDLEEVSRLYLKVYSHADVGERWTLPKARTFMRYRLNRQRDLFLVAQEGEKIVGGFAAAIKPWWDANHLIDGEIFVDPERQRSGIGSALSLALYRLARSRYGATRFDAITFSKKHHPLSWYKKQGFREIKEWTLISGDLEKVLKNLSRMARTRNPRAKDSRRGKA